MQSWQIARIVYTGSSAAARFLRPAPLHVAGSSAASGGSVDELRGLRVLLVRLRWLALLRHGLFDLLPLHVRLVFRLALLRPRRALPDDILARRESLLRGGLLLRRGGRLLHLLHLHDGLHGGGLLRGGGSLLRGGGGAPPPRADRGVGAAASTAGSTAASA